MIQVDDYSSFHQMHRWKELEEVGHYLSLYFFYHYIPYWRNNQQPDLNRMIDSDIKILGIWEGRYGLNPKCVEQQDDVNVLINLTQDDISQYDVILDLFDSEIHPTSTRAKIGLEEKIAKGEITLRTDQIYICFKSRNAPKNDFSFYNMKLTQSFSEHTTNEPLILKDMTGKNSHHNFRLQYGPWPLDYLDMESFPPWKKKD